MKKSIGGALFLLGCILLIVWIIKRGVADLPIQEEDISSGIEIRFLEERYVSADQLPYPGGTGMLVSAYTVNIPEIDISFVYEDFLHDDENVRDLFVLSGNMLSVDNGYIHVHILTGLFTEDSLQESLAEIVKTRGDVVTCPLLGQDNFLVQGTKNGWWSELFFADTYITLRYDVASIDSVTALRCPFMLDFLDVPIFVYAKDTPDRVLVITVQDGVAPAPSKQRMKTLQW